MMRYRTITATLGDLDEYVNDLLDEGWRPLGAPVKLVETNKFLQALIKENENEREFE